MTWSGPVNLMTLASTSPNYMWGMSSDRVSYLDISDGKLERVAEAGLPGITMKTQEQLTRIIADHATYDELPRRLPIYWVRCHKCLWPTVIMSCATRITMLTPMQVR